MFSNPKRNSQNLISNFNNMNYRFNEESSISLGLQSFMEIEHSPRHKQQSTSQLNPPSLSLLKAGSVPKETAIARYAFTAQKEKDLTFNVGDLITIEKKRQNGWWIGTLSNGKRGYFPNNYVEVMPL